MRGLDGAALDRWITGNYGEDFFRETPDDEEDAYAYAAREVEALADGTPCGECGRADDWLFREVRGAHVVLDCDDCGGGALAVPLARLSDGCREALGA